MSVRMRFAVVCSSNMNRSMEAHAFLQKKGYDIHSYGTGEKIKIPGTIPIKLGPERRKATDPDPRIRISVLKIRMRIREAQNSKTYGSYRSGSETVVL
jgi:hypothetical protein